MKKIEAIIDMFLITKFLFRPRLKVSSYSDHDWLHFNKSSPIGNTARTFGE